MPRSEEREYGRDLHGVLHSRPNAWIEQDVRSTATHESFYAPQNELIDEKAPTGKRTSRYDSIGPNNVRFATAASHASPAISELNERIRALETQLGNRLNGSNEIRPKEIDATTVQSHETGESYTARWRKSIAYPSQIKPQLRERTWMEFICKAPTEDLEYAIDVLIEEPPYEDFKSTSNPKNKTRADKRNIELEHGVRKQGSPNSTIYGATTVSDRIRINSPLILRALTDIDASLEQTTPMVMLRPFKFLVHHQEQIRDLHRRSTTENVKLASSSEPDEITTTLSTEASLKVSHYNHDASPPQEPSSVEHLQCLINFIDIYLKPVLQRFSKDVDDQICFRDLWYIFAPGENVYFPLKHPRGPLAVNILGSTAPEIFQSRYEITWRACGTGGGRPRPVTGQNRSQDFETEPFWVNLYYIDFDGRFFCPIIHKFCIPPFTGTRTITSLDFYPVRFQPDFQKIIQDHIEKGWEVYKSITEVHTHAYYAGPTLTAQPCGCSIKTDPPKSEYVESEVIMDFRTTLRANPSWRPATMSFKPPPIDPDRPDLLNPNPARSWITTKSAVPRVLADYIYDDYQIDEERAEIFRKQESIFSPISTGMVTNQELVSAKNMMILAGRVFGYVLKTRTFGRL